LQAGTAVNGKIAPKSIVMEVADLIPLTGKAETQDAVWQVTPRGGFECNLFSTIVAVDA